MINLNQEKVSKIFEGFKFPSKVIKEVCEIFMSCEKVSDSYAWKQFKIKTPMGEQDFSNEQNFFKEYDKEITSAFLLISSDSPFRISMNPCTFSLAYKSLSTSIHIETPPPRNIIDRMLNLFESYYKTHKSQKRKKQNKGKPMKEFKGQPFSFWKDPSSVLEEMQKAERNQKLGEFEKDLKEFQELYVSPRELREFKKEILRLCIKRKTSGYLETKDIKVFIGHGHDPQWKDLRDFLHFKLHFDVKEYGTGARAGYTIQEVLDEMSKSTSFALLVHTGEDEDQDGKLHARQNVVHETGLFQAHVGSKRAIVLLEEGCEEFSNIHGLQQIRFSKGRIQEVFGEVVATIYREFGVIGGSSKVNT